jgi:hypothetical protein
MANIEFRLTGRQAPTVADQLVAVLTEGDDLVVEKRVQAAAPGNDDRKVIDPISLATLIVSLPAAALAVADLANRIGHSNLVERIAKRRKAQALIATATQLRAENQVETYLLTSNGASHTVAELDPDMLLALVSLAEPTPPIKDG